VLIAPVSREIPCEQGILQGIPRFSEISRDEVSLSPCCDAVFSSNSLPVLTGKLFRATGNLVDSVQGFAAGCGELFEVAIVMF
jgi:hypothetical protein